MTSFFAAQFRNQKETDATVMRILATMSLADVNADRGGYYKSAGATMSHHLGGITYFAGLLKDALPSQASRIDAILANKEIEGELDAKSLSALAQALESADANMLAFVESLSPEDLEKPVKFNWYPDTPTMPVAFFLHQTILHGVHHRGQVSQMLDELKVDNDFSGMSLGAYGKK